MSSWPVLAFDIETIPDVDGLRRLRDSPAGSSDEEVLAAELAQRADGVSRNQLGSHALRIASASSRRLTVAVPAMEKSAVPFFVRLCGGDGG